MKNDALKIAEAAIKAALPYENTVRILKTINEENIHIISLGKAAVPMAKAAEDVFGKRIKSGLLITKYAHSEGFSSDIFDIIESGHPISDENSEKAAEKALTLASSLTENDTLIVLLSGGGSALCEKSIVSPSLYKEITERLLSRGAEIREINAIRKRLSLIKGGRLASAAFPAKVITAALSDVLSNDKGIIASSPTVKDTESDEFVNSCTEKYLYDIKAKLPLLSSDEALPVNDGGYFFAGDINLLCEAAEKKAEALGYTVHRKRRDLTGEASHTASELLASVPSLPGKHCFTYGGECTVTINGNGKGGRNQEAALMAAIRLQGKKGIAFLSIGSDGTDGPTDAAGGYADGESYIKMLKNGICPEKEINNNNSYYALKGSDGLIITGPTGTNVNDLILILTDNYEI